MQIKIKPRICLETVVVMFFYNGQKEKDRQHNGQKEKDERTNNDIRNITHKTKNRVTLTPLKTGDKHSCPGRAGIPLT
jgi:hypothetical protein